MFNYQKKVMNSPPFSATTPPQFDNVLTKCRFLQQYRNNLLQHCGEQFRKISHTPTNYERHL